MEPTVGLQIKRLRQKGLTYSEISKRLPKKVAKSTISYWSKGIFLTQKNKLMLQIKQKAHTEYGRIKALNTNKKKRELYLSGLIKNNIGLLTLIKDKRISKLILVALFIGEGTKKTSGSLVFANSNPEIIKLFLTLLRQCYPIKEGQFRCTVQGRYGQNFDELNHFWSKKTRIPLKQFYKARIDPRTVGKPLRKLDYKGVCRIDYLSADTYHDLSTLASLLLQ